MRKPNDASSTLDKDESHITSISRHMVRIFDSLNLKYTFIIVGGVSVLYVEGVIILSVVGLITY